MRKKTNDICKFFIHLFGGLTLEEHLEECDRVYIEGHKGGMKKCHRDVLNFMNNIYNTKAEDWCKAVYCYVHDYNFETELKN